MTYSEIFGPRILYLLGQKDWSVKTLAKHAGIPASTINNIIQNKRGNPTIHTLISISSGFEITLNEFTDIPLLQKLNNEEIRSMKPKRKKKSTNSDENKERKEG